jgi:pantetheine-phosphate adenylyltransferase
LGHVDVIERAACLFDCVIVLIAVNSKKTTLFDESERLAMAQSTLAHLKNVRVEICRGLVVTFAMEHNACALIRGIRAMSDFDYEFQIALMNRKLAPDITTIFLTPNEKYTYLNSSIIRELSRYGQDVSDFVSPYVADMLKEKFKVGS